MTKRRAPAKKPAAKRKAPVRVPSQLAAFRRATKKLGLGPEFEPLLALGESTAKAVDQDRSNPALLREYRLVLKELVDGVRRGEIDAGAEHEHEHDESEGDPDSGKARFLRVVSTPVGDS